MEKNLTIDRGNTALKGVVWNQDGTPGAMDTNGDKTAPAGATALDLLHDSGLEKFGTIIYCTVVGSMRQADIDSLIPLCDQFIELSADAPLPFSIDYYETDRLGADRMAAIAGAVGTAGTDRPILVVDIGTAITYEMILPGAHYMGGNISPGIETRLKSLHDYTDALPVVPAPGPLPLWGTTTDGAIRAGVLRGVAFEISGYRRMLPDDTIVILTGGAVEVLADDGLLDFDYIYDKLLVHRGLNYIIKYSSQISSGDRKTNHLKQLK